MGRALETDLYELTMAAGYFMNGLHRRRAVFELFCHTLPPRRSFLIACGLQQAVEHVLRFHFDEEELRYLRSLPVFARLPAAFFDHLSGLRFSGTLRALPEGEICFAREPILQVEAPLIEAQLLETYLLSVMHIGTLVASKAARIVRAAGIDGRVRPVVDFGARRAHGPYAALAAARAAYIAGCSGTSHVEAGRRFGIPVFGTMAHSWVQVFDSEEEAFRAYQSVFPGHAVFVIDTFDPLEGARRAACLEGDVRGVRIDSGDLEALSREVRRRLDRAGRRGTKILVSGDLDEERILRLVRSGVPVDLFGVGTRMVVSRDQPSLDFTYKLVAVEDASGVMRPTSKLSLGKRTLPGVKQVYRYRGLDGLLDHDLIALQGEVPPVGGRPLLKTIIADGRLAAVPPATQEIRDAVAERMALLPPALKDLEGETGCGAVRLSPGLESASRACGRNGGRPAAHHGGRRG